MADQAECSHWMTDADVLNKIKQVILQLPRAVNITAPPRPAMPAHIKRISRDRLRSKRVADCLHCPTVSARTMNQNRDLITAGGKFVIGERATVACSECFQLRLRCTSQRIESAKVHRLERNRRTTQPQNNHCGQHRGKNSEVLNYRCS